MQPISTPIILLVGFFSWIPMVVFSILLLSINGFVSAGLNLFGILLLSFRLRMSGGDQVNKVVSVLLAVFNFLLLVWFVPGNRPCWSIFRFNLFDLPFPPPSSLLPRHCYYRYRLFGHLLHLFAPP